MDALTSIDLAPEFETAIRVAAIIVVLYVVVRIMKRVIRPAVDRAVRANGRGQPEIEIEKRIVTLAGVIYGGVALLAVLIGLMTVLPEVGINTTALLAGTSLVGLAVGFGAQSAVKDIISGLFVLVENQFGKGDVVNIAGVGGVVEDISLRRTVLRDLDGAIHTVPNGQIAVASNLTRTWSRANMIVTVSYNENLDRVFRVIDDVGDGLAADPEWSKDIVESPKTLGVESFGDSGIDIRILGVTQPIRQWDVMRELRRRLKIAFDKHDIEIPYPHRTLVSAGQKAADGVLIRMSRERIQGVAAET